MFGKWKNLQKFAKIRSPRQIELAIRSRVESFRTLSQNFLLFPLSSHISRRNHQGSIIITRNRARLPPATRAFAFPRHNGRVYQPRKRFHAELSGNERDIASVLFFFPADPTFSPPCPPFFPAILASARPFLVSLGYMQARLNCRRFSMGAVCRPAGEIRSGKPVYIHGHVAAAKRGKIVKVYLVCSHRDDYPVEVLSFPRFSSFSAFLSRLLLA